MTQFLITDQTIFAVGHVFPSGRNPSMSISPRFPQGSYTYCRRIGRSSKIPAISLENFDRAHILSPEKLGPGFSLHIWVSLQEEHCVSSHTAALTRRLPKMWEFQAPHTLRLSDAGFQTQAKSRPHMHFCSLMEAPKILENQAPISRRTVCGALNAQSPSRGISDPSL